MAIELRAPTPADAPVIGKIIYAAFEGIANKHNFPCDFKSPEVAIGFAQMLTSPGSGFFGVAAEEDGRVVGSNFLDERDAIHAVGPITIDPTCQARGIGRKLMEAVIQRGRSRSTPGIRLVQEAYNTVSMSLYTSLGFETKEPLALMAGTPRSAVRGPGKVRALKEQDLPQCAALCRKIHGFDRTGELRGALAMKMFRPYVLERQHRIVAYASGPEFFVLNHGVAETEADLQEILAGASAANDGMPLSLLMPTRRTELFRWCLSEGLRILKPFTLMAMGEYREPSGAFYPSVAY